jgi:hypothetical protein
VSQIYTGNTARRAGITRSYHTDSADPHTIIRCHPLRDGRALCDVCQRSASGRNRQGVLRLRKRAFRWLRQRFGRQHHVSLALFGLSACLRCLTGVGDVSSDMIPTQKGFPAYGGYYREEAILALRRFYITSNTNGRSGRTCVFLSWH